jgi:hypothetical protein
MIDMNWIATNTIRPDARNQWLLLTHRQSHSHSHPTQSGGVLWKRREMDGKEGVRIGSGRSLRSVISKTNVNFDAATIKCDNATMQNWLMAHPYSCITSILCFNGFHQCLKMDALYRPMDISIQQPSFTLATARMTRGSFLFLSRPPVSDCLQAALARV